MRNKFAIFRSQYLD